MRVLQPYIYNYEGLPPMQAGHYAFTDATVKDMYSACFGVVPPDGFMQNDWTMRLSQSGPLQAHITLARLNRYLRVCVFNSYQSTGPVTFKFLSEDMYGIYLQLSGDYSISIEDSDYRFPASSCALLHFDHGNRVEHTLNGSDAPFTYLGLLFDGRLLQKKFHLSATALSQLLAPPGMPAINIATPDMKKVAYELIGLDFTTYGTYLSAEAKALELIAAYLQNVEYISSWAVIDDTPQSSVQSLYWAKHLLEQQYQKPPSLYSLGRQVGLNRRKLAQEFKWLFGKSVYEYVVFLRMEKAKKRLKECRHGQLGLIAEQLGYSQQGSFSKAFKQYTGYSPSAYINLHNRKELPVL